MRYGTYYTRSAKIYLLFCIFVFMVFIIIHYLYIVKDITIYGNETNSSAITNILLKKSYEITPTAMKQFMGERVVHLDLKGAPPKISYYKKLFPLFSKMRITAILIEYEDMFPYRGNLSNICALNAYTMADIEQINDLALENGLIIIPLIQTFGHMEFILKLKEYKYLREVPEYPQVICPTHNDTLPLITDMAEQILAAHPRSTMIHIGADEVYHLGECSRCYETTYKHTWSKHQLFLNHVTSVAQNIYKKRSDIRILIWDDIFRDIELKELKDSGIQELVEPVVWKYTMQVYDDLGPSLWDLYASVFPKVWIASAFKGATGSNQFITNVNHHIANHRSWMMIVNEQKDRINFQGILITGWQRYDHFAVLCELLPVGLPSLAMSLRLLLGYYDSPLQPPLAVADMLQCEQPYALMGDSMGSPRCFYPGGELLEHMLNLQNLKHEYLRIMDNSVIKGWMNNYNIKYSSSNTDLVQGVTSPLDGMKMELLQIEIQVAKVMTDIYDNYTINEWIETHIRPFQIKIIDLWEKKEKILSEDIWPRRPVLVDTEL